jgi:hypothetical protein
LGSEWRLVPGRAGAEQRDRSFGEVADHWADVARHISSRPLPSVTRGFGPVGRPMSGVPGYRMTGVASPGSDGQVDLDAFGRDGYVAVRGAVDAETAAACQELIWAAMERRGVRRDDAGNWPPLVEGMDDLAGEPFVAAYLALALTVAYDERGAPARRPVKCIYTDRYAARTD